MECVVDPGDSWPSLMSGLCQGCCVNVSDFTATFAWGNGETNSDFGRPCSFITRGAIKGNHDFFTETMMLYDTCYFAYRNHEQTFRFWRSEFRLRRFGIRTTVLAFVIQRSNDVVLLMRRPYVTYNICHTCSAILYYSTVDTTYTYLRSTPVGILDY